MGRKIAPVLRDEFGRFDSHRDAAARFWPLVIRGEGCWMWNGATGDHGYGRFWLGHRMVQAHRASWQLANGPIPKGLRVLHRCDNPACVNPHHLFLGTQADNVRDCIAKGRVARIGRPRVEIMCKRGHPFTDENTIRERDGRRKCRTCRNDGLRRSRARLERVSKPRSGGEGGGET